MSVSTSTPPQSGFYRFTRERFEKAAEFVEFPDKLYAILIWARIGDPGQLSARRPAAGLACSTYDRRATVCTGCMELQKQRLGDNRG